ncbi:MAG: hypothetical protein U0168_29585 [Nannocystaceae bacterium]
MNEANELQTLTDTELSTTEGGSAIGEWLGGVAHYYVNYVNYLEERYGVAIWENMGMMS